MHTQKLTVASAAASTGDTASIARDGYTATSAADLKSLYADALRKQNLAAYLQSGAKAKGDDYPWFAELSRNQGGGLSPLNYYYRECVDFVAWRLNRDAGTTTAPFKLDVEQPDPERRQRQPVEVGLARTTAGRPGRPRCPERSPGSRTTTSGT